MTKTIFFAAVLILFFGCVEQPQTQIEFFTVSKVIDGDTVVLENSERVRLIGIDSTEKSQGCFEEAKEMLAFLVDGKSVLLERDVEERDKYGRLLGYLFVGEDFVNLKMVEEGFAYQFNFPPNSRYAKIFAAAQEKAKAEKKGCLWQN